MPKKQKIYNNFDDIDDIPKENEQNKKNFNNKKLDNNFVFDKVVISPSIINKEFPQISLIMEEYKKRDKILEDNLSLEKPLIQELVQNSLKVEENKKNDKILEENLSLEKPLIQEYVPNSLKVEENKKIDKNSEKNFSLEQQLPQISSIIENKKNDKILEEKLSLEKQLIVPNSLKVKENKKIDKISEEDLSLQKPLRTAFHFDSTFIPPIDIKNKKYLTNLEIKNIYEKKNNNANREKKNFVFDKNIILLPHDLNENITFQTFQILEDFKTKSYGKILLNTNSLIQPKIPFLPTEKSYIKPVFNQYKEKYIFTISKESFINKIKLKDWNFNEIKNINDILNRKKNKNIFESNKNMINEKPIIEFNENKNECLISYQTIINKKIFLFDYNFSFDRNTIKKLDATHNIDINYLTSNKITNSYKKKNLKFFDLNNNDTMKRMELILEENEKNDTIFSNNHKRLVKKGFTKRIEKPVIDNEKINVNCNIFHPLLIENINKKKFKSFSLQNNINEKIKIKINKDMNIFSKIIYIYKQDINTSRKIKIPKENSIEEVNDYYSRKNLIKILSSNILYSKKDDLDIFNDIDLDYNYKLYKKFKDKKRKKMNKFLKSGKASTFLVNNDNLKMNIAYSQVYYNSNYNNIANKADFLLKKDSKKFKSQQFNSTNKNKIEIIKKSNMNYSDLESNDNNNEKEKEDSGIMKKIIKTNNEINRKNKKIYINKLKMEQDNKFEQELKKEKRFKFLFPIFFSVIPLFYSLYQKFIIEE